MAEMMRLKARHRPMLFALLFMVIAISVDQATKLFVFEFVMQPPRVIPITGFLNLTLGFNNGVSFGLFSEFFADRAQWLAAVTGVIALIVMTWAVASDEKGTASGLGLIAGGAAGNTVDRLEWGAVRDFIDFHVAGWHWPTFNLADVSIFAGAVLLLATILLPVRLGRHVAAKASSSGGDEL